MVMLLVSYCEWLCCCRWCSRVVVLWLVDNNWGAASGAKRLCCCRLVHADCDAAHGRQLHRLLVGARHDGSDTAGLEGREQHLAAAVHVTSYRAVGLALDADAGTMPLLTLCIEPRVSDLQECPVARGG